MNRIKWVLILAVVVLALFAGVFFYGRHLGKSSAADDDRPLNVKSQVILDRITSQYFLVTKTVFVDSQAEIETPKSNDWKDLFLGKKITVDGLIRVDVGVDIKDLRLEDIVVDSRNKTVTIDLPAAEVLDASLFGQLDVDVDKAVLDKLKGVFEDTQNEDYNLALQTLINDAKSQVTADAAIFNDARADSAKLVELIVTGMLQDYQVVIE